MWNWQSQLPGGGSGTGGRVSRTHWGARRFLWSCSGSLMTAKARQPISERQSKEIAIQTEAISFYNAAQPAPRPIDDRFLRAHPSASPHRLHHSVFESDGRAA